MKLMKKLAAVFIAAAISLSPITAYADSNDTSQTESGDAHKPDTTIDISDKEYEPIDKTQYVKWKADEKPAENTKYYIDETVKIPKDKTIVFPQTSTLVICEKANLQIYADASVFVYGTMIIEPKARVTVSGLINFKEESGCSNYGTFVSSLKAIVRISSDFVNHKGSSAIMSGQTFIYKAGSLVNRGQVTLAQNSDTSVTGYYTNAENGKLFLKGKMAITISGTASMNGYFSLIGELTNSGKLIFEKTVRYYKLNGSRLAASKSSRIFDYRKNDASAYYPTLQSSGIKGIDVSSWQEAIDWKKVRASGVRFAMIRSSFHDNKVDKTFEYNIIEAARAGIDVGVYHYCYALTVEEARAEAKHFIETISPYKITYPVVLDFEDNSQLKLDNELKNEIAKVFIEEVRNAGYYPMFYSYTNWINEFMDMKALDCEVWVAHWGVPRPGYKGDYGIWQYSCEGIVSGIDGYVDLNAGFKDYAKIIREGGYNNLDKFEKAA